MFEVTFGFTGVNFGACVFGGGLESGNEKTILPAVEARGIALVLCVLDVVDIVFLVVDVRASVVVIFASGGGDDTGMVSEEPDLVQVLRDTGGVCVLCACIVAAFVACAFAAVVPFLVTVLTYGRKVSFQIIDIRTQAGVLEEQQKETNAENNNGELVADDIADIPAVLRLFFCRSCIVAGGFGDLRAEKGLVALFTSGSAWPGRNRSPCIDIDDDLSGNNENTKEIHGDSQKADRSTARSIEHAGHTERNEQSAGAEEADKADEQIHEKHLQNIFGLIIFFIEYHRFHGIVNMQKMIRIGGGAVRLYTLNGKCNISGERVREARVKMGMSQDSLAAKIQLAGLQLGQMAVSRIETGKRVVPDFELPIIAEVLGVTTDWLLGKE